MVGGPTAVFAQVAGRSSRHNYRTLSRRETRRNGIECMRLAMTRQSGNLEDYIARFTGSCLLVPTLDELTKVTLFIEGLSDSELRREVRREHRKSMAEVTRAARIAGFAGENCTYVSTPVASASSDVQDQVASQLAAVRRTRFRGVNGCPVLSHSGCLSIAAGCASSAKNPDILRPTALP